MREYIFRRKTILGVGVAVVKKIILFLLKILIKYASKYCHSWGFVHIVLFNLETDDTWGH